MESNGLPGGMFSGMGSGMLGLEMSLHHHHRQPPQQNPQNPNHLQHQLGHHEADHHPQNQQTVKQGYPFAPKSRTQQLTFSDEDEPGLSAEDGAGDGNRKSPWHRMKWTDGMVRLLIMAVFYIGDDQFGSEGNDPAARKKGGVGGGVLQKKGKWKSVSRAMMEKGFYVSPQQCEDKFNDLNKRYKRVNDILGKGTACRVVENQSLLETMDHLSPKMKDEVKKLLNSKHLFFREMCAYHNSCGGGVSNGGDAQQSAEVAAESSQIQQQSQQTRCLHSPENASNVPNLTSKMVKGGNGEEEEDEDEEEEVEEDEDDEEVVEGGAHDSHEYDTDDKTSKKKPRKGMFNSVSPVIQEFSTELKNVEQDGTKSLWEKRQWMRMRLLQLEEQRMNYQYQAFELEKERMKWLKFSSNKEREIEVEKLGNERMRLENERMVLLLRQKELQLLGLQQQKHSPYKRGDPSSITV